MYKLHPRKNDKQCINIEIRMTACMASASPILATPFSLFHPLDRVPGKGRTSDWSRGRKLSTWEYPGSLCCPSGDPKWSLDRNKIPYANHGAGIFTNKTGNFLWGKCRSILQHHGAYGYGLSNGFLGWMVLVCHVILQKGFWTLLNWTTNNSGFKVTKSSLEKIEGDMSIFDGHGAKRWAVPILQTANSLFLIQELPVASAASVSCGTS